MIDFKLKFPDTFQNIWITGISDQEVFTIEMPNDAQAPNLNQKNEI
jgi:hypothetical protein